MRAAVVRQPGPPDVLKFEDIECPQPDGGWVLIKVEAFGLNRSEMHARGGRYPTVTFPRILGVECVGTVREDPNGLFRFGQKVAAVGGGIGTAYDGSYCQFACVRQEQVVPLRTDLDWVTLATVPQSFLAAYTVLTEKLGVVPERSVLIRGGSSSVGMAAITVAKALGARVVATTRNPAKKDRLLAIGADEVVLETGAIAEQVRSIVLGGVDGVVELIGPSTFADSLRACVPGGVLCASGLLGDRWEPPNMERLAYLLEHVSFTQFNLGELDRDAIRATLQKLVDDIATGRYRPILDRVYEFAELPAAHALMEASGACGKLVCRFE